MRLRIIALGCTLTGALGFVALPPAAALADSGAVVANTVTRATLTLNAPATVVFGGKVALSGRLTFATGTPPAQTTVTVTRTGAGTAAKTFAAKTGADGSFTLTDTSPAKGKYTYTAAFAGDAKAAMAKATASVTVETVKPTISVSAPVTNNPYGSKVTLTVTLGPTFADRQVSLYASPYGEGRTLVATGEVNAQGKWYPTYSITRKTLFTAVFAGDSHNDPNSASLTLQAYAGVADRITGYFETTKIGGVSYDVFHGASTLTLYSTVMPAKHGECLEPETEQFESGKSWDADTKYGCDSLTSESHDTAPFTVNLAIGDRYRIRGDYIRGAKDLANLSQQGPWLYFEVVK
ncbi:MAG TPA: carboxypeptidase-like regulatory domain-containing protein [Trebonia sp.]